jgi:DNA-directed RNA polymerase subunit RPC12/RpoP
MPYDVTEKVEFGGVDDEHLPLYKCACGTRFVPWTAVVSIYPESPWQCDSCGRRLFFRNRLRVFQVDE